MRRYCNQDVVLCSKSNPIHSNCEIPLIFHFYSSFFDKEFIGFRFYVFTWWLPSLPASSPYAPPSDNVDVYCGDWRLSRRAVAESCRTHSD